MTGVQTCALPIFFKATIKKALSLSELGLLNDSTILLNEAFISTPECDDIPITLAQIYYKFKNFDKSIKIFWEINLKKVNNKIVKNL